MYLVRALRVDTQLYRIEAKFHSVRPDGIALCGKGENQGWFEPHPNDPTEPTCKMCIRKEAKIRKRNEDNAK